MLATRTADPYADADVIDARAPRFNQATVGAVSLLAVLTGWWWLLALLAGQLMVGLVLGRRFCLPCVLYFEVIQPRFGEGEVEDARPPRFANIVGASVLSAATLAYLGGFPAVGAALGGLVAALALLAATTGLCVGCELYRLLARLRGVHGGAAESVDLVELGADPIRETLVQFTHPLCTGCHELERRLSGDPRPLLVVDVAKRPDLARRYRVTVVPTAFAVSSDGTVLERLA
jgi:hypothetical protein